MGLQKRFLKSKPISKVTFRLPKEAVNDATAVNLVGEFNNWAKATLPMVRLKNGEFKVTLDLPVGREYQFRYLISAPNGKIWENDWSADRYAPSGFLGAENSVLVL
ncbi:MAG: glycoside hydrolase [bacterium]|nr:glycoside hydrolase [bacterium]